MTRRAARVLATVGVVAMGGSFLAACGEEVADLDGRTFTATEVRGHDLVEGSGITLAFADGQISAQAGCNTLVGGGTWDGGILALDAELASTLMACDDALMAQDDWLSGFLVSDPALSLDGDTLTLGDDATGMTLTETE